MEFRDLIHPPLKFLVALITASTLLLIAVFILGWERSIFGPILYALPFYTLVITCVAIYDALHPRIHDIKEWFLTIPIVDWFCSFPIVGKYRIDIIFKSQIRLYFSIAINIGYILLNVITYYLYHSSWFLLIATYYAILLGMCIILYRFDKRVGFGISKLDDLRITRLCAIILMTLNVILLVAIEMIIYNDAGYRYEGIVIYFMAAYTFFTSGLAFINLVRFSKFGNYVVTIIRMVVVAAALVSILALETALLFQFGGSTSDTVKELLVVFTGIGISTIIVGMAMRIIALTSDDIRIIRLNGTEETSNDP